MSKNFKSIAILFFLAVIISCVSPGARLKETNPTMYNNVVGTYYILSPEKIGDIKYTIMFNDDGTVSGDTVVLFGYSDAHWNIHEGNYGGDPYIVVYNGSYGSSTLGHVEYITDKDQIPYNSINPAYFDSIPPLKILIFSDGIVGGKKGTYIYSYDLNLIKNLKTKYSDNLLIVQTAWEKLNKNSISEHIEFLKSVTDSKFKTTAEKSLYELLDKKIIKYIQKEFKSYSKYSDKMIVFEDGTEVCKLYELLKNTILGKNNISGEKNSIKFNKNKDYTNGFDIVVGIDGDELIFNFKPYKNNLVIMGLSKNDKPTPKGWEYALKVGVEIMNTYPKLDSIDIDLLEKL